MKARMLQEYDPRWAQLFERASAEVAQVDASWVIEHIGSTAIPGMAAKPIIDLAVRVGSLDEVRERRDDLAEIGWLRIARGPRTHLVLVRQRDSRRTHIAHFFAVAQRDTCNQRIFPDWLLTHEQDAARYLEVRRAAARFAAGGRDYTARKTAAVQGTVDRARAARGLPPVDVWDK